ncbi:MAG TPA: AAA family ATPase, partial [Ktedonobacteraceae bacterium]|nr:AAA family ATPase [Ktedonobacteraceae bacterium]
MFLFDCCYSGDFHRSASQDRSGEQLASHYMTAPFAQSSAGHIVLSSCLPHQTSREEERLQHGVFTYHLLEVLEGHIPEAIRPNGWITMGSLFDSLSEMLPDDQRPVKSGVELDTFKLLCYPSHAIISSFTPKSSSNPTQGEKESRLNAMMADHSAFMRDRVSSFVGRMQELEDLHQRIDAIQQTGGYVTITGQAGQGKSSIIAKLVEEYGPEQVAHHFIPFNPGPDHQVGLLRNLMARLICKYRLSEIYVASESRPALRDYFPKVLREIVEKGGREVIFIDGLDQLEEDQTGGRDLSFLPNNPPPGIAFVLGTRPNDTLRPLELLKPRHEYPLPNLSRSDFDLILQHRHVHLEQGFADRFYEAMEHNALYLDLVAKELLEARDMSLEDTIHRISSDPDYLFTLAIERLKRGDKTLWKEVLYPTLGLLLAAREPLSRKQIRQLLCVEDYRCRDGMMKLGGLVTEDGQQRYSLFHLKLRDYLRQDEHHPTKEYLFALHEEEQWHLVLADWCEQCGLQTIWLDARPHSAEQERHTYVRKHYITHLYYARAWDRLFVALNTGAYGKAKNHVYDPSTRSYAQDLDLGRRAAAWERWTLEEGIVYLSHLWGYTLLRCSLTSRADRYPIEAFRLLVQLKRTSEAIGLAELLTDPISKVKVFLEIVEQMKEESEPEVERLKILLRACEIVSIA